MNCVIEAWSKYEGGLRGFLLHPLRDHPLAEDLLQDTFLQALSEGSRFCQPVLRLLTYQHLTHWPTDMENIRE